jgi:flagellar biosynthetic protein FliQ
LGQDALKTTAMLSGPLLISALVIGLAVSIFQALTQINESTLTFIPKMLVVALVIVLAGPWMLDVMTQYTTNLFENIATFVRE